MDTVAVEGGRECEQNRLERGNWRESPTAGVMGRKFCEFVAGSRLLECATCSKPLTSIEQRHSANFVSSTGKGRPLETQVCTY